MQCIGAPKKKDFGNPLWRDEKMLRTANDTALEGASHKQAGTRETTSVPPPPSLLKHEKIEIIKSFSPCQR